MGDHCCLYSKIYFDGICIYFHDYLHILSDHQSKACFYFMDTDSRYGHCGIKTARAWQPNAGANRAISSESTIPSAVTSGPGFDEPQEAH
jgi:hypothetical protein